MKERSSLPSTMVWHIFTKDLKILWPLAATAAVLQALLGLLLFRSQPYSSNDLDGLAALITLGLAISLTLLIVLAVQQDALPSVNQDWLVRPIKRRDLLLAKLLAVVLLVHGPIIAVQVLQGLGAGFYFGRILSAALLSSLEIALVFSLPVMAIAALTKSVTEAILVALAIFFGLMLTRLLILVLLFPVTHVVHLANPTDETGVAWVWKSLSHALLLLATIAVLVLQYFRRCTRQSRVLFFGGLLLFMLIPSLFWQPAFAIQQLFSTKSSASRSVAITLDPTIKADAARTDSQLLTTGSDDKEKKSPDKNSTSIFLALRFNGLPNGMILHADHSAVRLLRADGKTLYRGTGQIFDVRSSGTDGRAEVRQLIEVPTAIHRRLRDQTVQLDVAYSLTLLQPHAQPPLSALNGDLRISNIGHCASRMDPEGKAIEVSCLTAGELPPCMSLVLEQADQRSPEKFNCTLNYQPDFLRFSEEPIDHSRNKLPLPDAASSLEDANIILRVYEPEDHFSRRILVPDFRLRDWEAPPNAHD
jgi:hypothetical protein